MDAVLAERDKLRAEVERLRATDKEAKSAFAPWVQGPGIVGGILHLQEEVERLRADANARAVEELRKLHHRSWYGVVDLDREIDKRIVELSKPAARESEPVRCIASLGDNHCEKGRGHAGLHCCRNVEWSESTQGGEKIETWVDDWTVTLAAQAKVAYVNSAEPADELKVRLLSLVVEGLCNLGREVRRGGKS